MSFLPAIMCALVFYTADKLNVSFGTILCGGLYFKLNLCLLVCVVVGIISRCKVHSFGRSFA